MKVLQISHGYNAPFMGVSQHYNHMLTSHGEVTTLYLTGIENESVREETKSNNVLFWELASGELTGLKLALIWKLYKFIREEKFELVICHRYKAIYMTAVTQLLGLNFKQFGVIHGFGDFKRLGRRAFLSLFKERLLLLGVSDSIRDDIRSSMAAFPKARVQTLYNAIHAKEISNKQLDKKAAREHLGLMSGLFTVGNVGRLHPDKDQATLLRAFAIFNKNVPLSQLVIIGSGRLERQLKQLSNELNLEGKVVFLGQVNNAVNYYRAFDLFALSSDKEPFGLVLLEAMVAELPVISTNCGGAAEVVAGVGGLFDFGDVDALHKLMLNIESMGARPLMTKGLLKIEESFSYESTSKRFAKVVAEY